VPKNRNRVSLVCADPAQFLFQNDRVTALLDFELAYLGVAVPSSRSGVLALTQDLVAPVRRGQFVDLAKIVDGAGLRPFLYLQGHLFAIDLLFPNFTWNFRFDSPIQLGC
jgi:hypothetical protein